MLNPKNAQQVLSSSWDGRPFGHNRHGPKIGVCVPLGKEAGSSSKIMSPGPRSTSLASGILIHPSILSQQTNRHGPKTGAAVSLFWGRGASWVPCNTRPISVPSGTLIHPAVWPQQTWAENWGLYPFGGSWVPIYHNVAGAEAYLQVSSWSIQPFGPNTPTLQADRTGRQRSDSIERTVLETVTQKHRNMIPTK